MEFQPLGQRRIQDRFPGLPLAREASKRGIRRHETRSIVNIEIVSSEGGGICETVGQWPECHIGSREREEVV